MYLRRQELLTKRSLRSGIRDFCIWGTLSSFGIIDHGHTPIPNCNLMINYNFQVMLFRTDRRTAMTSDWYSESWFIDTLLLTLSGCVETSGIWVEESFSLLHLLACLPWNALFSFWSAISRYQLSQEFLKLVLLMRWEWKISELGVLNLIKRKLITSWSSRAPVMSSN